MDDGECRAVTPLSFIDVEILPENDTKNQEKSKQTAMYTMKCRAILGGENISGKIAFAGGKAARDDFKRRNVMSAPSRRPEIRRRRTRKEKILKLRKKLAKASATEREKLEAKLHRHGLASPANPLLKKA